VNQQDKIIERVLQKSIHSIRGCIVDSSHTGGTKKFHHFYQHNWSQMNIYDI